MNKKYFYIFATLIIVLLVAGVAVKSKKPSHYETPSPSGTISEEEPVATATATSSATPQMEEKLIIQDEVTGTGPEALVGKSVTVNYVGTLTNGAKFDSSYDNGTAFTFKLGAGEVIAGWDQGVTGMKVGGKRKLTIPPSLAYGVGGIPGVIPPNSTLIFEIELLKVE